MVITHRPLKLSLQRCNQPPKYFAGLSWNAKSHRNQAFVSGSFSKKSLEVWTCCEVWCLCDWGFASQRTAMLIHNALECKEEPNMSLVYLGTPRSSGGLCCCCSVFVCFSGVCRTSQETITQYKHTQTVHRDWWWWCTASVCWRAYSAAHDARRAKWLRLTQEARVEESAPSKPHLPLCHKQWSCAASGEPVHACYIRR